MIAPLEHAPGDDTRTADQVPTGRQDESERREREQVSGEQETVGDRVRKLREARYISRAGLASQVGVHLNTVRKLDVTFWIGVHEVRTGITSLSAEERRKSKEWSRARGLASLDDEDI